MPPKKPEVTSADLYRMRLANMIDQRHELVRLAKLIDWDKFDQVFGSLYDEHKGRAGLPTRLMAGLHLLKHMKGLSDEQVCATWLENPYYQAFCGEEYFQHDLPLDRSSLTRWRQRIGAEALEVLLTESISVALRTKAVSPRQLERITVDTTVQPKAIAHPTDGHLLLRAIEHLNRAANKHGIPLRQSFRRLAVQAKKEAARLMYTRGHKQGQRWLRKMRTWLGRLIRDIERKTGGDPALETALSEVLERARRVWHQEPHDKNKLYALHAPEVECIGKGKARTRYEFGVKVSIATINERAKGGQFVVGTMSLPGNPYDGHSLGDQIKQVEGLTNHKVRRAYVDRGYRGHGPKSKDPKSKDPESKDLEVFVSYTRGITSPTIKRELGRRNAIEPVIGHMKDDGLLGRNHLKGTQGDAINAILCAAGHNMRLLAKWIRLLLAFLLASWAANQNRLALKISPSL